MSTYFLYRFSLEFEKSQFYNSTAVICFLGTLMSLKLDYANICRGQTKAQQKQIHKIIKETLVVFYFYSVCSSLNISQTFWMLLSLQ